jgi:DNA-binding Lrp family transcriptional regulator
MELRLLNDFQRAFPLTSRPFETIGFRLGLTEAGVIERLRHHVGRGSISRVGAVFSPGRIGASTLAAMPVPPTCLPAVAELVSRRPEVNHNYEREHHFNLWFVACAANEARLTEVLDDIERESGLPVMRLPLIEDYHIDLGFDLSGREALRRNDGAARRHASSFHPPSFNGHPFARPLLALLQDGLPLLSRPYAEIARRMGVSEKAVLAQIAAWLEDGTIKRLGVVVRHRPLGYMANAMVVFDIPDSLVGLAGRDIAKFGFVTLCYRRPRRLPDWPYNLFCMIHGTDRHEVLGQIEQLRRACGLESYPHAVLFSRQAFKQRGARYVEAVEAAHG